MKADAPQIRILDAPPKAAAGRTSKKVVLAALGDLMLTGEWDELAREGRLEGVLEPLRRACEADLVFANLEVTCAGEEGTIAKEPRVIGEPRTLEQAIRTLGVDLVNLANNHTFDALWSGYEKVRQLLGRQNLRAFGAGANLEQASRPLFVERHRQRFGILTYTALDTRPSHVAAADRFGVNPLDEEQALVEAERWSADVDHLIVSLHWGVEYCHLPSPDQIRLARALLDRGARLVLGHHAHVVQGVEAWGEGAIVYNLGNALTSDLTIGGRRAIRATAAARSSFVARATFAPGRLEALELIPYRADRGAIRLGDPHARALLESAVRGLEAGVSAARWKRVRLWEDVVLRTLRKLDPRVIGSLRPRHFARLFQNLWRALRGRGPA